MAWLFIFDGTTGATNVETWVVLTTLVLLAKFAADSAGPRIWSRRSIAPLIRVLDILNAYSMTYTLGLMKPSSSSGDARSPSVRDLFQVWAVVIVIMRDSVNISRPYTPKQMTLVDLVTSLWSADVLRHQTRPRLMVPLWLMWSIHAARIIWFYVTFSRATETNLDNIKLVTDYMSTSQHTDGDNACPADNMRGYRYIVVGEEEQSMDVDPDTFRLEMKLNTPKAKKLLTLEKVWHQAEHDYDKLLSTAADGDCRFKDACLSFALYKLQRRRFYSFPIAEATSLTSRRLVSDGILQGVPTDAGQPDGPDQLRRAKAAYKRAFRVTEVELSLLQDFFYSKHAAVFATGVPYMRFLLSLLMTAAALFLVNAVRDIPSSGNDQRVGRISHGVAITHGIIAIVVAREFWDVGVYVLSQWTKVWIICNYIKLMHELHPECKKCQEHVTAGGKSDNGSVAGDPSEEPSAAENPGCCCWKCCADIWYQIKKMEQKMRLWILEKCCAPIWYPIKRMEQKMRLWIMENLARIMFCLIRRGRWNQKIRQYNLLMSTPSQLISAKLVPKLPRRMKWNVPRKVNLSDEAKTVLFQSLKSVIKSVPADATVKDMNEQLACYFRDAFPASENVEDPTSQIEGDIGETHKILVWHITTSLCQIKTLKQAKQPRTKLDSLPAKKFADDLAAAWPHYIAAVTLSNYCAYLVTQALVPDNGLVANKVLEDVICEVLSVQDLRSAVLMSSATAPLQLSFKRRKKTSVQRGDEGEDAKDTILRMGAQLFDTLQKAYGNRDDVLWERLAKFWAGFLLHLSASTRAAKHNIHLQGPGELTTHLWVLLSHAGFLGNISHGEQMLDPDDRNDAM